MTRSRTQGLTGVLLTLGLWAHPAVSQPNPSEADLGFSVSDPRMGEFVVEVLEANPALAEAWSRYRAALQKIPQVSSMPDPTVTFTGFVRQPETRVGPQTSSLMVSQRFPWFGKLDLEGDMASLEARGQLEAYRALERQLVGDAKEAISELAYVDAALAITREEEERLGRYEELASARYATGNGLQQAVIRIQAEITRIVVRLESLEHDRRTIEARLNLLRGRRPEEAIAPFDLAQLYGSLRPIVPSLESLYATGERNRPELRARLDEVERSQLALQRARKDYWPDLTFSAGVVNVAPRRDPAGIALPPPGNGRNVLSVAVGINIPLGRDRYRAAELAAVEGIAAERSAYRSTLDTMQYEVRTEVSRIESLESRLQLYDQVLRPQAEAALSATEAAYETASVDSLDLLDAEGVLLEIRLGQARMRADYLRALAGLERALGSPLPQETEEQP